LNNYKYRTKKEVSTGKGAENKKANSSASLKDRAFLRIRHTYHQIRKFVLHGSKFALFLFSGKIAK
jgi:hypothetical protein